MAKAKPAKPEVVEKTKRSYLSQTDVPSLGLEQALRVPRAIAENYAGKPITPLKLASALNMTPSSGPFKTLCGASIAYGLTEGGYNAQEISITALGKRIIKPLEEGDDQAGKREAILKPRVLGEFLNRYDNSPLPRHDIAMNVLEEMKVPADKTESVYSLILDSAHAVGLIREIKSKQYVDLTGVDQASSNKVDIDPNENSQAEAHDEIEADTEIQGNGNSQSTAALGSSASIRKVFITHGKDKACSEPIKKLLGFGELVPVVSVEKQSVSKPVPEKVMDDMRGCGAAIIHVADELKLIDQEANERVIINPNVLIEIGAAMALYGRRFILLVKDGVDLPSNLQGLYEVRYKGESLDGDATIKLLEAINDIKNNPLPGRD